MRLKNGALLKVVNDTTLQIGSEGIGSISDSKKMLNLDTVIVGWNILVMRDGFTQINKKIF